ncbi:MAG: DAK2 domain-containing protein [Eubacterium sp.]|nr:DAK2 domain-containing protein [Eubacterium sp.]
MQIRTIDAELIRKCFLGGANALDAKKDIVNELNVFPVPDGDTGTNMTMTIMSAAREVAALPEKPDMKPLCKAISGGSLKGARGNSGVILSQLLRGFTKSIQDQKEVDSTSLRIAFDKAVSQAYKAVMKPKEGTILTVARAGSEKALEMEDRTDNLVETVNAVLIHMEDVLEQTPDMLPVLKEAGVVDSGGQGLLYFLQGCYDVLLGKEVNTELVQEQQDKPAATGEDSGKDIKFVYRTGFSIIIRKKISEDKEESFKSYLDSMGEKVSCTSDGKTMKVLLDTNDPGLILGRAMRFGALTQISIINLKDDEPAGQTPASAEAVNEAKAEEKAPEPEQPEKLPHKTNAFISVSAGDGISEIFRDLGVDVIIEGGQTMNPSTEDILTAIDRIDADHIFILPNNGNILLAADQAKSMSKDQDVRVIRTKNIPQGVASMLGFIDGVDPDDNETAMNEAAEAIIEGEVTYAVRDTQVDGHTIKTGDIMGISGKRIEAVGTDIVDTTVDLLNKLMTEETELVTLYYGEEASEEQAAKIAAKIGLERLDVEFEIQYGGQPIYYYFISVE